MGEIEEAREHYRKAVELEPENLSLRLALVDALEKSGELKEALQVLKVAQEKEPDNRTVQFRFLDVLVQAEEWAEAETLLETLSSKAGKSPAIRMYQAKIAAGKNQLDEAHSILYELVEENPSAADLQYELAVILLRMEDKKSAQAALEKALQLKPDYEKAKELLDSISGK